MAQVHTDRGFDSCARIASVALAAARSSTAIGRKLATGLEAKGERDNATHHFVTAWLPADRLISIGAVRNSRKQSEAVAKSVNGASI